MIPEAELADAGAGLVPRSEGWFVINARDARCVRREGRGVSLRSPAGPTRRRKRTSRSYARFPPPAATAFREGWLPGVGTGGRA